MEQTRTDGQSVPTWRDETFRQGRTLSWIALTTGKSARTVYAYSRGELVPSEQWLARVADILGCAVGHVTRLGDAA